MLRLDFWPKNRASRLTRTWASIYHFFKFKKKLGKLFAFFAVVDQNSPHHHPYAFPAKNCDFGRKNVYSRKGVDITKESISESGVKK